MVQRASTRQTRWYQNRCSTFKIKDFIVENPFWEIFEFGPLEASILTWDKKWPKWFRNGFSRAFERCLSFFSTATRSRDHGRRSNAPPPPPPPSRRWKIQRPSRARVNEVKFHTTANINSHDASIDISAPQALNLTFWNSKTAKTARNILMTLPFMITCMTFWVGPKDMLASLQRFWVVAMAVLALPWIHQCPQQHTFAGSCPYWSYQDGPFQKKLLPKPALSDIYLTERAGPPTEAVDVKTAHSERNCC